LVSIFFRLSLFLVVLLLWMCRRAGDGGDGGGVGGGGCRAKTREMGRNDLISDSDSDSDLIDI
jgi:hypothetical protein